MLTNVILEVLPYFAIAALCLGILMAWILRSNANRQSPQKQEVSAGFLIGLVVILFIAFLLVSQNTIVENSRMRQVILRQQGLLAKIAAENKAMEKDAVRLKGQIGELAAQKALYTATLETLVKKDNVSR
jgi:succinate-acetate transporter protein